MTRISRVVRKSGRKADLRWIGGGSTFSALAGGASGGITAITAGNVSQTIMRTRGSLLVHIDTTPSAGEVAQIGVALLIVPGGTGTTVTSNPLANPDAPYFYYETFHLASEDTAVAVDAGLKMYRSVVDVKAMRVLRPDQEVQFLAEVVNVAGAMSVNISLAFRMLIAD